MTFEEVEADKHDKILPKYIDDQPLTIQVDAIRVKMPNSRNEFLVCLVLVHFKLLFLFLKPVIIQSYGEMRISMILNNNFLAFSSKHWKL